ncbi:hypothetical protein IV203_024155 [Nitzschia inconspicua]|uniref:DUF6824 domain-containing protein n=1 Tax=Nitzschia inconspicua TaxID=303405 RepID=A0A9K3KBP8_9STRA|nr:hypothetical protein IV203_024155 [Nitzschia inconspicua]
MTTPGEETLPLSPEALDSLMAREVSQLSFIDRSSIYEEIHGVQSLAIQETPELIRQSLLSFQHEIDIFRGKKSAYDDAMTAGSRYVCSNELRIKFLRADFFDPKKAVARFLLRLENLFDFFGPVALQRPLQYSDLGRKETELLRKGFIQILPTRDRAGRLVEVANFRTEFWEADKDTRAKVIMYFEDAISEDMETQKNGLVVIVAWDDRLNMAAGISTTQEDYDVMVRVKASTPYRWSAVHICVPEGPLSRLYRAFILLTFGQESRVRARVYPGFNMETQYKLLTFGINVLDIPITHTGSIKLKNHLQWIKTRRAIDEARKQGVNFAGTLHPGTNDVLFSKGGNQNHHGNYEFRSLIENLLSQERYKNVFISRCNRCTSDREQRESIRYEIIRQIRARGGRFLALDKGGWWVELPIESSDLHDRVATSVYDHQKRMEARQKQKRTKSDTQDMSNGANTDLRMDEGGFCFSGFRPCGS